MQSLRFPLFLFGLFFTLIAAHGQGFVEPNSSFYFHDRWGHMTPFSMLHRGWNHVVHPGGRVDPGIDPRLREAAAIARSRANPHSRSLCWRYVKEALLAAGAVRSYPKTAYAAEAGDELVRSYGFTRLSVRNPYAAPLGAVLVYGNRGRGHVELRTKDGFASDYHSNNACFYRLIGAYAKSS
jgi:hypothetical protein